MILDRLRVRASLLGTATLVALVLGGCGGSATPPRLSRQSAATLRRDLSMVRTAASSGERSRALSALNAVAAVIHQEAVLGRIPAGELAVMTRTIGQARQRIYAEVPAPVTPAPAPAAAPAAAPPAAAPRPAAHGHPRPDHGHGGPHGHGDHGKKGDH